MISKFKHYIALGHILIIVFAMIIFFGFVPPYVEKSRNRVASWSSTQDLPANVKSLHQSLFIADFHSDSLLWNRDLSIRSNYGHLDIPRLIEGNIGLQVFSVVTKTPKGLNLQRNTDKTDNITLLAIAQRWPLRTWFSLYERAAYQAEKLQRVQKKISDNFYLIKTKQDLHDYLKRRNKDTEITSGLLSLEGAHALEGNIENVDRLFAVGFRIIGFTHFFDNELGGSAHGDNKDGITEFGREVVKRMDELGIFIDLAHASPQLMEDIFALSTRPILVTHTGIQAICSSSPRNLSDKQIQQVANSGGLIGIGFWPAASCTKDITGVVRSIRYVVDLVGEDYVALGSDFDGNVQVPFTAADMAKLTHALVKADLSETQIRKIMGENVHRVLLHNLPNREQ